MSFDHIMPSLTPPIGPHRPSKKFPFILAIFPILFLISCAAITNYDPTSYKNATDIKAESLLLMDKATEPPNAMEIAKIEDLRVKLSQAYEYEAGKEGPNQITVKQWKILNDPEGGLLGGFLKRWEGTQGTGTGLKAGFVEQAKDLVKNAFDQIIKLESAKVKN